MKKNPYIMTIGFDKTDSRHVQVAELLNGLHRKKAQYIVDAVLAYEGMREQGSFGSTLPGPGYEQIKGIVLQVLAEQGNYFERGRSNAVPSGKNAEPDLLEPEETGFGIDSDALEGIMKSLEAFRG